jgi:hypothetical protein
MAQSIRRVHYHEHQYLRAADFEVEQAYHVGMRRRHNLAHHTWGIVEGLELRFVAATGELAVRPGVAVDGYGRELVLADQHLIRPAEFDQRGRDELVVWIAYGESLESSQPVAGWCDTSDTPQADRRREQPRVTIEPFDPSDVDRRRPEGVTERDVHFDATRAPMLDPAALWPVYLGKVSRIRPADNGRGNSPLDVEIDPTGRPYAGARAESIESPTGHVAVRLGTDSGLSFEVELNGNENVFSVSDTKTECRGDVHVTGGVRVHGTLDFPRAKSEPVQEASGQEAPTEIGDNGGICRVYRWSDKDTRDGSMVDELRIVIPRSDQEDKPNSVQIGAWSDDAGEFVPGLTVNEGGRVTVAGDLEVKGRLHDDTMRVTPPLSEAAESYIQGAVTQGVTQVTKDNLSSAVWAVAAMARDEHGLQIALELLTESDAFEMLTIPSAILSKFTDKFTAALAADSDEARKQFLKVLKLDAADDPDPGKILERLLQQIETDSLAAGLTSVLARHAPNDALGLLGRLLHLITNTAGDNIAGDVLKILTNGLLGQLTSENSAGKAALADAVVALEVDNFAALRTAVQQTSDRYATFLRLVLLPEDERFDPEGALFEVLRSHVQQTSDRYRDFLGVLFPPNSGYRARTLRSWLLDEEHDRLVQLVKVLMHDESRDALLEAIEAEGGTT